MCTTLEEMMREGASQIEVMAEIDITEDTFYRWKRENDEFSESVGRGKLLSQAWWERMGRVNLENTKFNYRGWYMNMKNRFQWTDKTDIKRDEIKTVLIHSTIPHYPGEQDEEGYIDPFTGESNGLS